MTKQSQVGADALPPLPSAGLWIIPGDDGGRASGFVDAMAWEQGEFTKPMYTADQMREYAHEYSRAAIVRVLAELGSCSAPVVQASLTDAEILAHFSKFWEHQWTERTTFKGPEIRMARFEQFQLIKAVRALLAAQTKTPHGLPSDLPINQGVRATDSADAARYRWLRDKANFARKSDPMVCIYPLDEQKLICGDELDQAIDACLTAPEKGKP